MRSGFQLSLGITSLPAHSETIILQTAHAGPARDFFRWYLGPNLEFFSSSAEVYTEKSTYMVCYVTQATSIDQQLDLFGSCGSNVMGVPKWKCLNPEKKSQITAANTC